MPYYCQLHTAGVGVGVSASHPFRCQSLQERPVIPPLVLPCPANIRDTQLSHRTERSKGFFSPFFSIPGQQQSAGHGCGFNIVLMGGQRPKPLVSKPQVTESGVLTHLCRRSLGDTCDRDECLHCLRSVFETTVKASGNTAGRCDHGSSRTAAILPRRSLLWGFYSLCKFSVGYCSKDGRNGGLVNP